MARKTRKSILASVMAPAEEIAAEAQFSNEVGEGSSLEHAAVESEKLKSEEKIELQEKPQYEDTGSLTDEIHTLLSENNILKDKLASYIDELDSIRNEHEKLKSEYDKALMRISDLSFDNALLKSKIDELQKSHSSSECNSSKQVEQKQSTFVPYTKSRRNNNGYVDWN